MGLSSAQSVTPILVSLQLRQWSKKGLAFCPDCGEVERTEWSVGSCKHVDTVEEGQENTAPECINTGLLRTQTHEVAFGGPQKWAMQTCSPRCSHT